MSSHGRWFLKRMSMRSFGRFHQHEVGPFAPGLNVVVGKNEAGKTTCNAFVRGVLFGWEEARGNARNTYKPLDSERAGSLVFAPIEDTGNTSTSDADSSSRTTTVARAKNVDGLDIQGDADIVADIDRDTFGTMFALTSAELLSLGKANDVTARLLTAGAGTDVSPAAVLAQVEEKLAACFSKSEKFPDSIPNLQAALQENKQNLEQARQQADRLKQEDREFHELARRREQLSAALSHMNDDIQTLQSQRDSLRLLNDQSEGLAQQRAQLDEDRRALDAQERRHGEDFVQRYAHIDEIEERTIRESLDDYQARRVDLERSVDQAAQDASTSKGTYEAICQDDDVQAVQARAARQRRLQIPVSIVLPLLLLVAGIGCFIHGRQITSLSVTALGGLLVLASVVLAAAAVAMLFRPNKTEEAVHNRLHDANWVMVQDEKRLAAAQEALYKHERDIDEYLGRVGLGAAQGSLRRARSILDEIASARSESGLLRQRSQSIDAQASIIKVAQADNDTARAACLEALGEPLDVPISALDQRLQTAQLQRDDAQTTINSINARYGELTQELGHERHSLVFDECKLRDQMLHTRLNEAQRAYAKLLTAKRILEQSIASWEEKSQPAVYLQASALLDLMTDGAWKQVRISDEGRLVAVNANDGVFEPHLLSMGTCQQMYLALRIALLMAAQNVGASIPILADDILVNFDGQRQIGAARALALLAQTRQVIVFTCHSEIVSVMQQAESTVNVVQL